MLSLYLAVLDDQSDEEQFIDAAVDEQAALDALETFAQNWDNKYPKIAKSWRENWTNLSTYFKYPQEVRRLIYTANTIEGFNRQLRKVTKSKSVFPTDGSLLKNAVSGDDGYYEKVDGSAARLEPHPCAVVHLFR